MRRFKLVRVNRRKVEVQKIKLKVNFVSLLVAFLFACLVWLYVAGTDMKEHAYEEPTTESAGVESVLPEADTVSRLWESETGVAV